MSDRVAVMNAGVLEQSGAPEEVYRRPRTAFVADFVGASNRLPARIVREDGGGFYRAAIEGLGERRVAGVGGVEAGADVVIVVRPEELRLVDGAGADGAIPATVLDVAFLGAQRTVRLQSAQLGELVAVTGGSTPAPERGAEVAVSFRDEDAWAVPV